MKDIIWVGIKSQFHNNIRYQSLLPKISRLQIMNIPLIDLRIVSQIQYHVFSKIIIPLLCVLLSIRYRNMLCTNEKYIKYFFGSIIVDLDDPELTEKEASILSNKRIKAIVVTTKYIKKELIKLGVTAPILIIPQGVDLKTLNQDKIAEIRKKYKQDKVVVIGLSQPMFFIGKSSWPKVYDVSFLFQVMKKVWKKIPEVNLWMMGKVQESTKRIIESDKRIKMFDYIQHDDLLNYISNFDIAVYPRRLNLFGRFSIKILEYLACAMPVVSTDVDEAFILNASGGGIVAKGKSEFANSLIKLVADKSLRQKLGNRGKKFAQDYRWEDLAKRYQIDILDKYLC